MQSGGFPDQKQKSIRLVSLVSVVSTSGTGVAAAAVPSVVTARRLGVAVALVPTASRARERRPIVNAFIVS